MTWDDIEGHIYIGKGHSWGRGGHRWDVRTFYNPYEPANEILSLLDIV